MAGYNPAIITYLRNPDDYDYDVDVDFAALNLTQYKLLYIPSTNFDILGGISATANRALIAIKSKIIDFVNVNRGSLIVLSQVAFGDEAYGFLPGVLEFTPHQFLDVDVTSDMMKISPRSDDRKMDHPAYWPGYWTGPIDWNGLRVLGYKARECPIPYGANQTCRATGQGELMKKMKKMKKNLAL
ncbi:hypothetical protein TSOC_014017 [Tetrabaena socialis]|uniref:Uncharacterized protein n=1 Tax=Tetrabaena socialis TaxID=47790 RepID=A0A2J7ZIS7_9CHLO|nr:hypothetical protein TSOC_014017 [Tetrabaena socialis]|eukprot:PNH00175.1 hypothetical protein TSOC_014017 [Tetrabaena socialis]